MCEIQLEKSEALHHDAEEQEAKQHHDGEPVCQSEVVHSQGSTPSDGSQAESPTDGEGQTGNVPPDILEAFHSTKEPKAPLPFKTITARELARMKLPPPAGYYPPFTAYGSRSVGRYAEGR